MLSRMVVSSLALLFLAIVVLANSTSPTAAYSTGVQTAETQTTGATLAIARSKLPLTPPPIAPQSGRIGPIFAQPTQILTPSIAPTATIMPSVTVSVSDTVGATDAISGATSGAPSATLTTVPITVPHAIIITTSTSTSILPTVTPTPPVALLLPTPTTSLRPTAVAGLPTAPATVTSTAPLLAATPSIVTTTTSLSPTATGAATGTITGTTAALPSRFVTASVPLPASYSAQGSFASQTVFGDGTIVQQQGVFTIEQAAAANAYAANQHYALRTQRAVGDLDEIDVYQIDDYIAVNYTGGNYTGGDWMLVRRDQGSNIVRAIQPITDLAVLFPRIIHQAEFVGQENIAGATALRYRIDDPHGQGARLIQPLLALSGEIRSLRLEVWIAVPGGYVVAYNFQVELAGARVLNGDGEEVRADQAVTWTYQLTPFSAPETIEWPADAPSPRAFPVPGFAPGAFPVPPNTELLALVGGVPDLISTQSVVAIDSFYRAELGALGWTITGEGGLLTCNKGGATLQLLISEDSATNGTRISVLPGER